jgi:hypothetical protein
MQRITKLCPSAATVIACVALFMAIGGVGYAAAKISGKSLIDRSVAGKKLKKNGVGGNAIKESSLGQVPSAGSADTAANAQNAANAQHAQSADAVGPNGVGPAALQDASVTAVKLGGVVVRSDSVSIAAGGTEVLSEGCLSGERMLSGGAYWGGTPDADAADLHLVHSYPSSNSWTTRGYNGTGGAYTLNVRIICLAG